MRRSNGIQSGRGSLFPLLIFCAVAAVCIAGEAPAPPAAPASSESAPAPMDMSGILGEGSQLQAGKDGEFEISMDDQGQLSSFRAIKDVILLTKDIDLRCDDLIYRGSEGRLTATTPKKGKLVHITMHNVSPGADKTSKGSMRATCRKYVFHMNEKRHELMIDPIIYQVDKDGKEMAIAGHKIMLTQDKAGRWQMHVKGSWTHPPRIYDPKRKKELDRARAKMGIAPKPTLQIDRMGQTEEPEGADSATEGSGPKKTVKIDAGNVEDVKRPKSSRVMKLEEGG